MGSLAMWSGLAGAGKGLAEYSMKRIEDESYEKRSKIDEARDKRLSDYKSKLSREEETHRLGGQISLEMLEQGRADMRQAEQDAQAMSRVELQTQTQKDVAGINQAGQTARLQEEREARRTNEWFDTTPGKTGRGANDPRFKAIVDKYQPKTLTVSEANKLQPDNPLFNIEKDTPAIWDGDTWYLQKGNKYILPDAPPKEPPQESKAKAEQDALREPLKYGDMFLAAYNYLPMGYFKARRNAELAAAGYDVYGNPLNTE